MDEADSEHQVDSDRHHAFEPGRGMVAQGFRATFTDRMMPTSSSRVNSSPYSCLRDGRR
ncbi:hypothetical protein MCA1908 [Methylococcus capsulatus str. Bath]|uniref:Uncharacterized protein n=1 Tax=Methylococcus capsulatus (strain ATCC 33009 / NCIMB 11132 / Bath) TaxID=243233 RepID=Q606V5_METCA|nr:hypothetical protein MCA1908 [Methylococcus capsulatus str. Bath]